MNDQPQLRAVEDVPTNNPEKVQWKQIGTITIFTAALTALVTWTITYFLESRRKRREEEKAAIAPKGNPQVRGAIGWPGVQAEQEIPEWQQDLERVERRLRNVEDMRERVEDIESHQFRRMGRSPVRAVGDEYDE